MTTVRKTGETPVGYQEGIPTTSPESSRLSSLPSTVRAGAATSLTRTHSVHLSPTQPRKAGKAPATGSISDVSEHAVERAIHSTSRGPPNSPLGNRSGGPRQAYSRLTTGAQFPYTGGAKVHAPQPQVLYPPGLIAHQGEMSIKRDPSLSQGPNQGYSEKLRGPSGPRPSSFSPSTQYQARKLSTSIQRLIPSRNTDSPKPNVEIAVNTAFYDAGIYDESQKERILDIVNREFKHINYLMGREVVQPHHNLRMYLETLRVYMKTPLVPTEEDEQPAEEGFDFVDVSTVYPGVYEQGINPARQEQAPVDPNIEGAIGQLSAPRRIGESKTDFKRRSHAVQRMGSAEYQVPQTTEITTTAETQSRIAGSLRPAFIQDELRGQSTQVDVESPERVIVYRQRTLGDRAGFQKLRNNDLLHKGYSHISDQNVAFSDGITIDLERVIINPQGRANLLAPIQDEEEEESDRQSGRSKIDRPPERPPFDNPRRTGGGPPPPRPPPSPMDQGEGERQAQLRRTNQPRPRMSGVPEVSRAKRIPDPSYEFLGSEGVAAALRYHRERRVERLRNLIHKHLSVRISLPDGAKMGHSDGSSVPKYEGTQSLRTWRTG